MEKLYASGVFIFIGVDTNNFNKSTLRFLRKIRPSGIVLYGDGYENPQELKKILNDIKRTVDPNLLIAVDQEGGKVQRLKRGFTKIPSAQVVGRFFEKTRDVRIIYELGKIIAIELKAVGVNINLAPVLDIAHEKGYMKERAYSSNINIVEEVSLSLIAGMQDHHLAACGKHFPGHGATSVDSHLFLPKILKSEKELLLSDMRPFIHAIKNGVISIMVAHILYPGMDGSSPASLSYKIVSGYLKGKLGFDGFVLSDDIMMDAIKKHFKPEEACVLSLKAGVDAVIISRDMEVQERCYEAITKAIESGDLKSERVLESLIRVRSLKSKVKPVDYEISLVGCDAHRKLIDKIIENG